MADYNVQKTTSADLTSQQREDFDKQLIANAEPNLVYNRFGQKRNIPQNGGQTINFRRFTALDIPAAPLTEGVTPAGKSLKMTEVTAHVKQYGDYIATSDVLELTGPDMLKKVAELNKLLGDQAGRTLDHVTASVLAQGTNYQFANGAEGLPAISKEDVLTVDDIKKAVTTLKNANAPKIDGYYICIIHPNVAYDLMKDPEWTNVKNNDPEGIYKGELGSLYGVRFFESSEAYTELNGVQGSLTCYHTAIFGDNAYGVTEVEGGGLKMILQDAVDPLHQVSSQGWKAMHTAEILSPEFMVNLWSVSSRD